MEPITLEATQPLLPALYAPVPIEMPTIVESRKLVIEANTTEVTLEHLGRECIVPVFSKDNEVTLSHNTFIQTVQASVNDVFRGKAVSAPEVRVSHLI